MASRRQCQTSVLFEAVVAALFLGSLLLTCGRDDSVGTILALASRQRRCSTFLMGSGSAAIVSGSAGGVSAGVVAGVGGTLASVSTRAVATRALGSGSLSDFVSSFGTAADSMSLASVVGAATDIANGPAVLNAIAAPRPATQNSANQIVLDIPKG